MLMSEHWLLLLLLLLVPLPPLHSSRHIHLSFFLSSLKEIFFGV